MAGDVHTPDHPYCDDLNHACHTDVDYHELVTNPLSDEEADPAMLQAAFDIFGIDEEEE